MRAASVCFALATGWASLAFADPESTAQSKSYQLHGYYQLRSNVATWQRSDDSPWQVVKGEPWISDYLVKWGYVPVVHDSQRYYCQIRDTPRIGSNIIETIFVCGDPDTVQMMYQNHWAPILPAYGGH